MNISIAGHYECSQFLELQPNQLDVIFISSPKSQFAVEGSRKIPDLAKNCLQLLFDDIPCEMEGYVPVGEEDIRKALAFAADKDHVIVSCQAGISRSSAMAYIIGAARVGPHEALKVLNPKIHSPNRRILKLGESVLGMEKLAELVDGWIRNQVADEVPLEIARH